MTINSRQKGAAFERQIAKTLRNLWPEARRGGMVQSQANHASPDVDGTPFWIECKHENRVNWVKAHEQAVKALEKHRIIYDLEAYPGGPLVIYRETGKRKMYVALYSPYWDCIFTFELGKWIKKQQELLARLEQAKKMIDVPSS